MKLNHILITIILFIISIAISGCGKDDVVEPNVDLFNFTLKMSNNIGLSEDITLIKNDELLIGNVPIEVDLTTLIADFEFIGSEVKIGDKLQESGVTINDFRKAINYTITDENGLSKDFIVEVSLFTGLPIVRIYTDDSIEITSKEDYIRGYVDIWGGIPFDNVSGDMKIRGRGHSTWENHPKKPYQLKFDTKTQVLGMHEARKWIFLAEYSDKTLIRNSLVFEMGYISNLDWTPSYVFSEVFINDKYNGTYNLCEKIEGGPNRVNIGDNGYLCEIDTPSHLDPDDIFFNSTKFTIQIKEPETTNGSEEFNYIKSLIIEFEEVLYSDNFKDEENGYQKYIDVASFVDWYLINEISKNLDSKSYSSMYFSHIPGEKIKMGPLWDFDLSFGNVNYTECEFVDTWWTKRHAWFKRLFEDPMFLQKVRERFAYYRANEEYLLEFIDSKAEHLHYAQQENDLKWDIYGNYIWPNPVVLDTYEEDLAYLKTWFIERMKWLDEAYAKL